LADGVKRVGRPFLGDEAARKNFTFRMRRTLYDQIKAAAQKNDHSLSEEIKLRLEMSFDREATVRAVLAEQAPKVPTNRSQPWNETPQWRALYNNSY
jgi:hypothetical protein